MWIEVGLGFYEISVYSNQPSRAMLKQHEGCMFCPEVLINGFTHGRTRSDADRV